jgi:putative copper resistance protein D
MLAALVVQWMRASEREARRIDRALDRAEAQAVASSTPAPPAHDPSVASGAVEETQR